MTDMITDAILLFESLLKTTEIKKVVLFSAGQERYCVPHARFLLHGVGFNVSQPTRFEEKHLDERREGLMIDRQNIARIIAEQ